MKNNDFKEHLKENPKLRNRLRKIGFTLTIVGGLCILIAMIDFFSFDGFPTLFWLFFVGMFFLFPGMVCLSYGYMGSISRYQASEMAPVQKDTINYILDGTRSEITKTFKGIKKDGIVCPKCNDLNDKDSKFCKKCGCKLVLTCSNCNADNDGDSRFCKNCGKELR